MWEVEERPRSRKECGVLGRRGEMKEYDKEEVEGRQGEAVKLAATVSL